jgi:hypothetical protein
MGISKDRHGTYYAIKQAPKHLHGAVASVLNNGKARQSWLKRSLRTKDGAQANRTAKPVLIEFDRIIAQAEALQVERPLRSELNQREIEQIANFFYAHELAADEESRREGGSEELFQALAKQLDEAGVEYHTPYAKGAAPAFGLSDREMTKIDKTLEIVLPAAQKALARGDIGFLKWEIDELLKLFQVNLDPKVLLIPRAWSGGAQGVRKSAAGHSAAPEGRTDRDASASCTRHRTNNRTGSQYSVIGV